MNTIQAKPMVSELTKQIKLPNTSQKTAQIPKPAFVDPRSVRCTDYQYNARNSVVESYCYLFPNRQTKITGNKDVDSQNSMGKVYSTAQTLSTNGSSFIYLDSINVKQQYRGGNGAPRLPGSLSNGELLLSGFEQHAQQSGYTHTGLLAAKHRDGWFQRNEYQPLNRIIETTQGKPVDHMKRLGGRITNGTGPYYQGR